MSMRFADTLKKFRIDKGLSQQALAKKMYVTNGTISRWESGRRLPDADIYAYALSSSLQRRKNN
nr:helix-turn-helix transcriptional regulator [uncultured Ruminococcus sp.]